MTRMILALVILSFTVVLQASGTRTFTGVISDSMCARDHEPMKIEPEDTCVRECVKHSSTARYVLLDDARSYLLSDQETPAKFAGRKVVVKGVLFESTGIIKVESIEAAR